MFQSLTLQTLMTAGIALLLAGCSATPDVTSSASGTVYEIFKTEPDRSAIDILGVELLALEYPATTRFWLFVEQDIDFQFDGTEVSPGSKREPYMHWIVSRPDLTKIGEVNGLPVALHLGHLLVGMSDFGQVADGETAEFLTTGIFVDGLYRGPMPAP